MGKDQEAKPDRERGAEAKKAKKEVCCEKYLKKGKHCKDCPLTAPAGVAK